MRGEANYDYGTTTEKPIIAFSACAISSAKGMRHQLNKYKSNTPKILSDLVHRHFAYNR